MRPISNSTSIKSLFCAASAVALALSANPALAQSSAQRQVVIESQALDTALVEVGRRYGISIYAASDLTAGKSAGRVRGNLTAAEALSRVLAGSGLTYRRSNDGRYVVTRAAAPQAKRSEVRDEPVAQDEPSAPIVVTGTKANLSIQETDVSVAVVTEDDIDEQAVFELSDALLRVPNVNISPGSEANFSIRGIGNRGANFFGGRTSNIYLDGIPVSQEGLSGAFNLWDVSQIEVLRGPQATTQGRNALAGAIFVQSADPEYEFGARFRGIVATDETYQGSAMITGPIIPDQLAFRISADYREQDFDAFNATVNEERGENDALTIRGKLLFEPEAVEGLRLELNAQYVDAFNRGGATGVIGPAPGDPAFVGYDPLSLVSFDFRAGVVANDAFRFITDIRYDLSDNWYLALLGSYEDINRDIFNILDSFDNRRDDTYQIDGRLHFEYPTIRGWIGGYYFDETVDFDSLLNVSPQSLGFITNPTDSIVGITSSSNRKTENYAIYADLTLDLTDSLTINLGARYDNESVVDTGLVGSLTITPPTCSIEVAPGFSVPCIGLAQGLVGTPEGGFAGDFDAFLPKVGIRYMIDDDRSIAFVYSRGYRAGGADTVTRVPPASLPVTNIESFDPEFLNNYELSFRSTWLDNTLTINANAFFSEYTDQQVRIPVPPLDFTTLNAGESEVYGFEIAAEYRVTDTLDIYGGIGYAKTEFIDFPFAVRENAAGESEPLPNIPELANLAGNEFSSAPNWNASFGASYRGENGFFASFNGNYTGSQFSDVENFTADAVEGFFVANARIGYEADPFRVSLFVNNIFDDRSFTSLDTVNVDTGGDGSINSAGIQRFGFLAPRLFGVEIETRF